MRSIESGMSRFRVIDRLRVPRNETRRQDDAGALGQQDRAGSAVSADFQRALTQEVMRTELIRIKALIGTTAAARGHCLDHLLHSRPMRSSIVWHGSLKPHYLYCDHGPVHPVRTLGACAIISRHLTAGPRSAGVPALSRRADRNLDADGRAGAAHRQHGTGRGARLRGAADLFHLHHPLDAAAGFLALDLHRLRRGGGAACDGDVLSSGSPAPTDA